MKILLREKKRMGKYVILPTNLFLEQLENFDLDFIERIYEKLKMLEENPFRNKSLVYSRYNLFRIRLTNINKELRIIYRVKDRKVFILFILDRDKNYKDLEKYLKKVDDEF